MSCLSQPSFSESVINEDYSDFTPSVLPTLLAHRLSPSDDDSSTALYDSGVSSHTADANFDDDDDDDEPPPVLDLYGCSLPEPVQAIEDEAPSTPEDSSDGRPLLKIASCEGQGQELDSSAVPPKLSAVMKVESSTSEVTTGKVRRSVRQAKQKKAKDGNEDLEQFSNKDDRRAEVPDWEDSKPCEEKDRDVCIWINSESLSDSDFEQLCNTARRQLGMLQEEVLEALYKNHYNLLETLEHLEEFIGPRFEPFSRAEVTAFFQGMKACNNNDFVYIRTNYLPNRKVAELVDFYYKTKKTKCFGQPSDRCCPFKTKLCSDEEPLVSRAECANCCGTVQNKNLEKDLPTLCGICSLYYSKTKKLRPFYVPLVSADSGDKLLSVTAGKEGTAECSSLSAVDSLSEKTEHSCSFARSKLHRLRTARWTSSEKEMAVIAFLKFGKDFTAIANEIGTKSVADIKRFYVNFGSDYRLDFLVSHSQSSQKVENDLGFERKSLNNVASEQNVRRQYKKRRT
ncbi:unnamed protein product [Enterobius vermicularis]|uniref:SANT domain-containing protein n=1 Tax=Enterobius vermicularis TaxID=51028 RepID=A0A158QB94_ENTVE|nr:unnamed protein product [Enterobius vermicularis]